MRAPIAAILILAAVSCGGEKKGAEDKATNPAGGKTKSEASMKDTSATVDIGYKRGKITLTVPAGWTRASAEDEQYYGPTWYAPETPEIATYRPSLSLGEDAAREGETVEQHHQRRMEKDKKFAGNKFSGDELLDPENTIGRTLTPLAFEAIPGGWLWAYEVTYNPKTAGLLRDNFGITIWRYEPGDTAFLQFSASGQLDYKDEYFDKLVEIGKSIKIGD